MITCKQFPWECKSVTHPVSLFLLRGVKLVIPAYELTEGYISVERLCRTNVRLKSTYASPFLVKYVHHFIYI